MRPSPERAPSASTRPVKTLGLLLLLPLAILCCAPTASAVPVVITGGSAFTPHGLSNFGVSLTAPGFSFSAFNTSAPKQQLCGLCAPGGQFPGTIQVQVPDLPTLTFNGATYSPANAFIGSGFVITLPSLNIPADFSPLVSPFSFSGTISVFPHDGSAPFTFELTGAGSVTFNFIPNAGGGSTLDRAVFAFAPADPVPEPATMLLLGTGLAGAIIAARRRRKG